MAGYGNNVMFYQMLLRNGVPPAAAIGAMSSLMGESGQHLDPGSHNPNDPGAGGSVGMGQWNRERLANLRSFAASKGANMYDPAIQVGFIEHELNGTHKHVLSALQRTNDTAAAANTWTASYEAPAVNNTQQRLAGNLAIANKVAGGNVDTSAVLASGGGADAMAPLADTGQPSLSAGGDLSGGPLNVAAPRDPFTDLADTLADATTLAPRQSLSGLGGNYAPAVDPVAQATQAASAMPATPAGLPAAELSAPYDQAKLRGGPTSEANLADLFKVKSVGQARQIRPTRRIA